MGGMQRSFMSCSAVMGETSPSPQRQHDVRVKGLTARGSSAAAHLKQEDHIAHDARLAGASHGLMEF